MENLKVYIADDHALYRKAIVKMLGGFERVGEVKEAANGKELLSMVRRDIPDVAILDLEMPVLDGVTVCEKLNIEFPEVKIVVVSMHDSKTEIYHLLQLGAHAFLSKNSDVSEFESAIYSTVDKGFYRNQVMRDALRNAISVRPLNVTLTNREVMILELLCLGLTNKKIGLELSLSENTIRNHKVRIMRKAGVKNAVALVKFAVESGLIKNKIKPSD